MACGPSCTLYIGLSEDLLFRPSILVGVTVAFSIDYFPTQKVCLSNFIFIIDQGSANSEAK